MKNPRKLLVKRKDLFLKAIINPKLMSSTFYSKINS